MMYMRVKCVFYIMIIRHNECLQWRAVGLCSFLVGVRRRASVWGGFNYVIETCILPPYMCPSSEGHMLLGEALMNVRLPLRGQPESPTRRNRPVLPGAQGGFAPCGGTCA